MSGKDPLAALIDNPLVFRILICRLMPLPLLLVSGPRFDSAAIHLLIGFVSATAEHSVLAGVAVKLKHHKPVLPLPTDLKAP